MYDVVIIGMGPGGSTLARLLDKNLKVAIIDKKNDKITKCCGGLLSPDAQKSLANFDICLPKNVVVDPQIFSVKTLDFEQNIEKYYQRFYVNMNRAKFDIFLSSIIENNVEIFNDYICTGVIKNNEYFEVSILKNKKKSILKSKMVIGADGADSIVRRKMFPNKKIKQYVAIQEWYREENKNSFYSCIFDSKITDSYAWTISKDNHFIIGGAFPKNNCNERFEALKNQAKTFGMNFGVLEKREGCFVNIYTLGSLCLGKNNAYLIGEAAGMISPSSLEGISYAINSAKILADIINKKKNINKRYQIRTFSLRFKLWIKVIKKPFMYNKLLRKIVMKSNFGALKK